MSETAEFRLLRSAGSGEANCQSHIQHWLYEKDIRDITAGWQTPEGPADLYLPNRRCIIEVKNVSRLKSGPHWCGTGSPNGNRPHESAYEQVERYILAMQKYSGSCFSGENMRDLRWLGIVTDASKWWAWEWPITEWSNYKRKNRTRSTILLTNQDIELVARLIKRKVSVSDLTNYSSLPGRLEDYV